MIQRHYHCFIAGLPDLSFSEQKEWTSVPEFRKTLEQELHPDDFEQVKLVFLKDDHVNLLRFLEKRDPDPNTAGNFSFEDFQSQVENFSAIIPDKDILPEYMIRLLNEHINGQVAYDYIEYSRLLSEGYFNYIQQKGSPFLKYITNFDFNLSNLLTYLQTSKFGQDPKRFLTGDNPLVQHLKQSVSRTLVKDPEFEWFEEIVSYASNPSYLESETKYDQLRWQIIEDAVFFEEFSIDQILGYLHQMMIIRRWASLTQTGGESRIRELTGTAVEKARG